MIIKNATQVGNPIIRKKSKPVLKLDSTTKKIVKDLIDSMRYHELVGMAAPQIGLNLRVFVTEIRQTKIRKNQETDGLRIFINPVILSLSGKNVSGYEGCGSVAYSQLFGKVIRPQKIKIKAFNEKGEVFVLEADGLLARVIQHELDHLNGVVFLDRMTDTKSLMSRHEYMSSK